MRSGAAHKCSRLRLGHLLEHVLSSHLTVLFRRTVSGRVCLLLSVAAVVAATTTTTTTVVTGAGTVGRRYY